MDCHVRVVIVVGVVVVVVIADVVVELVRAWIESAIIV
jgi:hypothetical protein